MNWNGTVSLLIACLEFFLLFNLIVFTEKNRLNKIAILMIALLAVYQILEFLMCGIEMQNPIFPYFAFASISFLPPMNLIITLDLYRNPNFPSWLIFSPAVFFLGYYTFVIPEFEVTGCTVLYATYNYPLGDLYGFFYYIPIFISILLLIRFIKRESDKKQKLIGKVLLSGAILISLPVFVGFILMFAGSNLLISAIESVLCKFAFIYAICLSFTCLYNSPFKDERNYFKYLSGNK
jgi:hypothetical protein